MKSLWAIAAALLLNAVSSSAWASHPWPARKPPVTPAAAHQLKDIARWPEEPASPEPIDAARFVVSVDHLCAKDKTPLSNGAPLGATSESTESETNAAATVASPNKLGTMVLAAAGEAGVDPFLVAGLMLERSRCRAGLETKWGYGLLGIHPSQYLSAGAPKPPVDRAVWRKAALLDPATNLKVGSQLLKMWTDSHAEIDASFGGVPHRGPTAHFIWGDVVRGSGAEDQVLTARRRLVAFYEKKPDMAVVSTLGISLLSPLEGTPRVASSGPGEDRAGGKRQHLGIDLGAAIGEPVRSVASGKVIFAGANVPGAPRQSLTPARAVRYRWRRLGPGGIYVCIEHAPERHIVSCYMHLDSYIVNDGDSVEAGQEIGRVGRTGVQVSPPHLHFELRVDDRHVNPVRYMGALIIPPKATQTYTYAIRAKRSRLARLRN